MWLHVHDFLQVQVVAWQIADATYAMPPSHLKALKASLHQKGILGEQKSKKNRRQTSLHRPSKDDQSRKAAALQSLREQFNPFEVRPAKQSKYAIANESSGLKARPGVTRGLGEEKVFDHGVSTRACSRR